LTTDILATVSSRETPVCKPTPFLQAKRFVQDNHWDRRLGRAETRDRDGEDGGPAGPLVGSILRLVRAERSMTLLG